VAALSRIDALQIFLCRAYATIAKRQLLVAEREVSKISDRPTYDPVEDVPISAAEWVTIESVGKWGLTEPLRVEVRGLLVEYLNDQYRQEGSPAFLEVSAVLKELEAAAADFAHALHAVQKSPLNPSIADVASSALRKALRVTAGRGGKSFGEPPLKADGTVDSRAWEERTYLEASLFSGAASLALEKLHETYGQPGKTPDLAWKRLANGLAKIYLSVGGTVAANKDNRKNKETREWTSPFVLWVHALLERTSMPATVSAVGSAIAYLVRRDEIIRRQPK
jgi:hypothetical protein